MAKKKAATKEDIIPPEGEAKPNPNDLPGMVGDGVAKPHVEALDDAVREYVEHRDKRLAAGIEEKNRKTLVLALMDRNGLSSYEVDDLVVVKKPKDATASIKVVSKADYTGDTSEDEAE